MSRKWRGMRRHQNSVTLTLLIQKIATLLLRGLSPQDKDQRLLARNKSCHHCICELFPTLSVV